MPAFLLSFTIRLSFMDQVSAELLIVVMLFVSDCILCGSPFYPYLY